MKQKLCFIIAIFCFYAFTTSDEDPFVNKVVRNFIVRLKARPQEKLYVHTDREHYNAGERIWFRAYLQDAATHLSSDLSRFVYVELTDRQDSVYQRVKIACRDTAFAGYMDIEKKMLQGEYFIRAYSYWMQNVGEDYLFKKKIRILNPQDSKVNTEVTYTKEENVYIATIRFTNLRNEPYSKVYVGYQINGEKKKEKMHQQRADESGKIRVKLNPEDKPSDIFVKFSSEGSFPFERHLYVPEQMKDFEVSFFPEGGELCSGDMRNVAFKVIGNDGLSVEAEGSVYNDVGELMCDCKSSHKGMGVFILNVESGRQYYAMISTSDSLKKRVDLPKVNDRGIGLCAAQLDTTLIYKVILGDSVRLPDDMYLFAHTRGIVLGVIPLNGRLEGRMSKQILPEGILHLVLMDSKGRVYSQRLCFIQEKNRPELMIQADKESYTNREAVKLVMNLKSSQLRQLQGSFSISVTDDGTVERDSLAGNILSDLLLTSDLKGYIEEPGYYFRKTDRQTTYNLNLVMLTHGWTRFDIEKTIKGVYEEVPWYMERGQAISGKVDNFWGKDARMAKLILFSNIGMVRMMDADTAGRFVADGISYPQDTKFVIQAQSRKGGKAVTVKIDEDDFLLPENRIPYNRFTQAKEDAFFSKFQKDYYYDNGIKVYMLDEVLVKTKPPQKSYSFYDNMADYILDSAKIASMANRNIQFILQELPGVMVEGDKITRFSKPLYILVNNFEEDWSYVSLIQPDDLLSISFIRDLQAQMFFGEKAANGALVITTNPSFVPRDKPRLNMAVFSPLGYQKPAQFYVPKYEVDSVRLALADTVDNRSTVYWNPNVRTDDSGVAEFSFFTADSHGKYSILMEGILEDGTICRKEEKIEVKELPEK